MRTGYIPKVLTYVCQNEKTIECNRWWREDLGVSEDFPAYPLFVVDQDNEKTLDTAMSWAKRDDKEPVVLKNILNTDIHNVTIVALEIRSEGGRAYKATFEYKGKTFYVDFREDVLLDCIREVGIQPGGILNGTYIWGRVGSQMKLVRVGSVLHQELIRSTRLREKGAGLKKKDLVLGGVYRNRQGEDFLYLGDVSTTEIQECGYYAGPRGLGYYYSDKYERRISLWVELTDYIWQRQPTSFQELFNCTYPGILFGAFDLKKTKSVCEKVGRFEIPAQYIETIRKFFCKVFKACKRGGHVIPAHLCTLTNLAYPNEQDCFVFSDDLVNYNSQPDLQRYGLRQLTLCD